MTALSCFIVFKDQKKGARVRGLLAACSVADLTKEQLETADSSTIIFLTDQVEAIKLHPILRQARERVLFLPDTSLSEVRKSDALDAFNHVQIIRVEPPEEFPAGKVISIARATQSMGLSIREHLDHGAVLREFQLANSEQRNWFRDELSKYIESFVSALPRPSPIYAQYATEIQEELLMNAIWDASPSRAHQSRREMVILNPNETISVKWGFDGSKFAIAVRDHYGTFPPELCEKYLRCMFCPEERTGVSVSTDSPGGAGIGLYMIFARASQITVNVIKNYFTEVVVVMDFSQGPKNMAKGAKTFQFFNLLYDDKFQA